MTEAADPLSGRNQPETRDTIERYCRMAASAALCVAGLAVAYFGAIYWLSRR